MLKIDYPKFLTKWMTSELRRTAGMGALAKLLKVSPSTISMVENEKRRPGVELYFGMCIASGLDPCDYLIGCNELIVESNKLHNKTRYGG